MIKKRYLQKDILNDLKNKMVFIGGPRQVGKTTLARHIIGGDYKRPIYLNWDSREDRKKILNGHLEAGADLVIFDEIHKYKKWKNYLKGEFDKHKDDFHFIITGSSRLDIYRRGGDSLMGRYHYYRLHPFSLSECLFLPVRIKPFQKINFSDKNVFSYFEDLYNFGGFPEPFLSKDPKVARRFHNERIDRLIKEDIRDIENLRDLSALQLLVEILPNKVGSLLSLNSLREDLQVAHKTISLWVDILERFYYHFRIYPYQSTAIKSLRKEPKMYLWDWSQVENRSARLENIVASHLLKLVHYLRDAEGYKANLHFLRDVSGREVDFLVTIDRKPWFAAEVKSSSSDSKQFTNNLEYFTEKLKIPFAYQVIKDSGQDYFKNNIRVISVDKFLSGLI